MVERLLITILIGILALGVYLLFNHWQKRHAGNAGQQIGGTGRARLLYFRSEMCGSCRVQAHSLAQLDDPYRALIEPIEVEQAPEVARQYNIFTLPTTVLIDRTGKVRYINLGVANPARLTRQLEQLM